MIGKLVWQAVCDEITFLKTVNKVGSKLHRKTRFMCSLRVFLFLQEQRHKLTSFRAQLTS